ncbi:MAG TPA: zinc ribbon domain-containing protein [Myxococcota bacterium]|nr:zinc ribbon domain-containing protein [Myxococcota bacterium]
MPMYEYECSKCKHQFELLKSLSERDDPCECPACRKKAKMKRLSSLFSSSGSGGSTGNLSGACSHTSSGGG